MTCDHCQQHLLPYLYDLLEPIERAETAGHLELCADCRAALELAKQQELTDAANALVKDGTYKSYGEALFNLDTASGAYSCARCHTQGWSSGDPGQPGVGAMGPNLTGGATNAHFPVESDQIDFIKKGSVLGKKYGLASQGSGRMPGFGNMLTDEQIKAIVEYVRSL